MNEELKEFLTYLSSLWGLLASVTVFFPFSNHFLKIIPVFLDNSKHTLLASLISTFMLFWLFTLRHKISSLKEISSFIALGSFLSAVWLLWDYLNYMELIPENTVWITGELHYVFEYGAIFGLFTTSFTILALVEYYRSRPTNQ